MGVDNEWHLVKGMHVRNLFAAVSLLERQYTQEKAMKPMEWQWTHCIKANWNGNEPMAMKSIETAMSPWQLSRLKRQWARGNEANWNGNEPMAMKPIEMAKIPRHWSQLKRQWARGNEANRDSNEPMAMKPIEMAKNPRHWSQLKW
jgi:hypothetical protein